MDVFLTEFDQYWNDTIDHQLLQICQQNIYEWNVLFSIFIWTNAWQVAFIFFYIYLLTTIPKYHNSQDLLV